MDLVDRLREYAHSIGTRACDAGLTPPSEAIVTALSLVPRHALLEQFWSPTPSTGELVEYVVDPTRPADDILDVVYSDKALVTRLDDEGLPTSSTSQPALVAGMLELLDLRSGMRVLEIGAGTGYNAALIAELVADQESVTTVDIQPDVVEQTKRLLAAAGYGRIRVLCGDGMNGAPQHAPFDRVVATVACPDISWRWVDQLAPGGEILVPLMHGSPSTAPLVLARPITSGDLEGRVVAWSGFMPLQGDHGATPWPESIREVDGRPDATFDLPRELSASRRTMDDFRAGRRAWWDFAFFLALDDERTHFGQVLALLDRGGARLVLDEKQVSLFGSDAGLYEDLLASYDRWVGLGRPAVTDWHVRLIPRDRTQPIADPSRDRWVVTRPQSWQLLSLG